MNKKALVVIILFLAIVGLAGYKFLSTKSATSAGLKVTSDPTSSVFLNDKLLGKTPYDDKHATGEYVLKLIPLDAVAQTSSWQGKIQLNPSVLTYVNRSLGPSELTSAGEILTLEKIDDNQIQLAVLTTPDGASVLLDGVEKGPSPLLIKDVSGGEHDVAVTSAGFVSRTIRVVATSGYKLIISFQLALSPGVEATSSGEVSPSSSPTSETKEKTPQKPYVTIKDTPTGFLRVRSSPNTSAQEVAQVKPGEKYSLLEEKEGWFKISYSEGKDGWISGKYAQKEE